MTTDNHIPELDVQWRLDQVLAVVADMRAQIGFLQRRVDELERLNGIGPPPPPLEPCFHPLKEAAEILGYSQADLLKHIKCWKSNGGYIWWAERDGQLFVDVPGAPLLRVAR